MTTVEIVLPYTASPADRTVLALARLREVYGIHSLKLERAAQHLVVDYDATRLDAATVSRLVRQTGLAVAANATPA